MIRNNLFWVHHIHSVFIPQIDAFNKCVNDKVLPAFANIDREAEELEQELYERLLNMPANDNNADINDIAESAQSRAIDYYCTMEGMKKGIICLFTSGLYHLFEQQLFFFYRKEILSPQEENEISLMTGKELNKRLKAKGLDIKSFKSFSKIDIIRLINDVVKHAEGSASRQLRERKPEYFRVEGNLFGLGKSFPVNIQIFQPLIGKDLTIPLDDFNEYCVQIKEFWNEFCEKLK